MVEIMKLYWFYLDPCILFCNLSFNCVIRKTCVVVYFECEYMLHFEVILGDLTALAIHMMPKRSEWEGMLTFNIEVENLRWSN